MKKILLFLFITCHYSVFAQNQSKILDSKIEKVIVFLNGAQIVRTAKTTLTAGKTELVFRGISPNVNKQSIQVKGEGKFTVLSVVHQSNFLVEQAKREEIEKIRTQQETIKDKMAIERTQLEVFKQEEAILLKNQQIAGQNVGLKTADLKEAVDFQRARLSEVKLKQLEIEKNLRKLDLENHKLDNQLKALNQRKDLSTSEILVTVNTKEITASSFTLTYLVQNARWYPTYDLRVKDVNSPINLFYKANILQNSGEDWQEVKLTLSTGNPDESGQKPNLQAWYLNYAQYQPYNERLIGGKTDGISINTNSSNEITGKIKDSETQEGIPGVSIFIKGTSIGTVSDANGNYSLQKPGGNVTLVFQTVGFVSQEANLNSGGNVDVKLLADIQTLSEVVVTGYGVTDGEDNIASNDYRKKDKPKKPKQSMVVNTQDTENQISIDFDIETPYTIPTDGKVYTVDIKEYSIPAIYEYYCAPKLDKDAFLTAKIVDWEDYNLLEGESNLFFEGAFLGKSLLDVRNVSDTLEISLGRDKNVVVTRTKLKDFSKRQFLGNNKTENRTFEITIRNKKSQAINLILQDQYPLSTMKEIEVDRLGHVGASLEENTGKLTWKLKVNPSEDKKIEFKYSVKYPKSHNLDIE